MNGSVTDYAVIFVLLWIIHFDYNLNIGQLQLKHWSITT